eukprot:scaffold347621_cov21-Prasinocladus_malaysianus.AAC.1
MASDIAETTSRRCSLRTVNKQARQTKQLHHQHATQILDADILDDCNFVREAMNLVPSIEPTRTLPTYQP